MTHDPAHRRLSVAPMMDWTDMEKNFFNSDTYLSYPAGCNDLAVRDWDLAPESPRVLWANAEPLPAKVVRVRRTDHATFGGPMSSLAQVPKGAAGGFHAVSA
ncbi:hypothetical protein LDO32_08435 [Luteimonas sp. Y-2-2-4F]|nr:hypothetical protein [Luteimonas sp. Y-2-2-4F]